MSNTTNPAQLPVIDRNRLNEVTEGDESFQHKLFAQFQGDMERNLSGLEAAIQNNGGEPLIRLAHNIKGTSANIGVLRLSTAAAALELAAREGRKESYAAARTCVEREYAEFLSALKELQNRV